MKLVFNLFLTFLKIGAFTFGGGYAMLSLVEETCVDKKGWISKEEMDRITVIAESTPGPVALNCATYVGFKQKGLFGAIAASAGVVLPSFVTLFVISLFLDRFLELKWAASAFMGVKVAGGLLILDAAIRLIRRMPKKPLPLILFGPAFIGMLAASIFAVRISTIVMILAAAAVGLIAYLIGLLKAKKGGGS